MSTPVFYQDTSHVLHTTDARFDVIHKPGDHAASAGVYRCEGCGNTIYSEMGNPLPPQNHHQHTLDQGSIRWRLLVWV